jgi:hypothetical protein
MTLLTVIILGKKAMTIFWSSVKRIRNQQAKDKYVNLKASVGHYQCLLVRTPTFLHTAFLGPLATLYRTISRAVKLPRPPYLMDSL